MSVSVGSLECSADAAVVLALAGTAVGFADGPAEEAGRWLLALESAGDARRALERARRAGGSVPDLVPAAAFPAAELDERPGEERFDEVMEEAREAADGRGSRPFGTADLLRACLVVYGAAMERALLAAGTPPQTVLESLEDTGL